MPSIHVLSTVRFDERQLAHLRSVSPRLQLVQHTVRESSALPPDVWPQVEVLCTFGALPEPGQAPRLRWVQLLSAGAEHATSQPALGGGDVILTTTSGIHAISIGEYVLAQMLAWSHKIPAWLDHQRRAEWPQGRFQLFRPQELR
ncbi:MAG: hypothetical protein GY824_22410, partial [Delftia sp.]|nr:hypothetical protein [Delftia sp.]